MRESKVALFDFCETLVNFQTADPFVDYVRKNYPSQRMLWLERIKKLHDRLIPISIIEKVLFPKASISKRIKLFQLKGFSKETLDICSQGYYRDVVKPNLIESIINELAALQNNGYKIFLVSGGYEIYLRHFIAEFNLDGCFSSRIMFKKTKCCGLIDGADCMYQNKVKVLDAAFKIRPTHVIAYSDSLSDLPMLKWADEGIVVSHNSHKEWVDKYKLKEILWR